MTIHSFECPECLRRVNLAAGDVVDRDAHGRPLCEKDGMPMLPVTLRPGSREDFDARVDFTLTHSVGGR